MRERASILRRAAALAGLRACLAVIVFAASGQTIDLPEPVGESKESAPAPANPSAVATLIRKLEAEAKQAVASRPANVGKEDPALDPSSGFAVVNAARMNLRLLVADLLAAGDRAAERGRLVTLAGVRLADARESIDAALDRLFPPLPGGATRPAALPEAEQTAILDRLRSFNRAVESFRRDPSPIDDAHVDALLPELFADLARAVSRLEEAPLGSHWIPSRQARPLGFDGAATSPVGAEAPQPPSIESLRERLRNPALAELPDPMRPDLDAILEFLERGSQFDELLPRIAAYSRTIGHALDVAQAAKSAASWLKPEHREAILESLGRAVALFRDPGTREAGRAAVERLRGFQSAIERLDQLAAAKVDVRPLIDAWAAAESQFDDEPEQAHRRLSMLSAVIDRLLEYDRMDKSAPSKDLREIDQALQKSWRTSTKALLAQIGAIVEKPDAMADPALASVLSEHRQLLADLKHLRAVPQWIKAIATIDPPSAAPFERQLRKACRWLVVPTKRSDAAAALGQFEEQLALFERLPFEDELQRADPAAIAATGGRHEALLKAVRDARLQWARSWADGDASSPAGRTLLAVARLTAMMRNLAEMQKRGNDAAPLNRWSAWELDPAAGDRPLSDVAARLRLATAAAIPSGPSAATDEAALRDQVDRLERDAPFVMLCGGLSRALGGSLRELPSGGAAALAACVYPPEATHAGSGAATDEDGEAPWLLDERTTLATLCRFTLEREHARLAGDRDAAHRLDAYVNSLASRLLERLETPMRILPAVSGFDGSDPNPKVK